MHIPKRKIVIMEHSGIGNLLHWSGPIKELKNQHGNNISINVCCWKRSSRILEGLPSIDIIADEQKTWGGLLQTPIDDLYISPVGVLDNIKQHYAPRSKNVHEINIGAFWGKHEVEYKAQLLGVDSTNLEPEIQIFEYNIDKANQFMIDVKLIDAWDTASKFICINAAYLKNSHWSLKHWGNKNYTKLIESLIKIYPDHRIIFVGSNEDSQDAEEILAGLEYYPGPINACGLSNDIKDTAALLSKAVLLVGNDGGLQHVAAAVGIPTVTIFTFTNPIKNRPYASNAHLVMEPCPERIQCQHGQWNKCGPKGCLNLPVEKVVQKIKDIL
jgi:ADP-heptose:LPS heptosyltransferase